MKKLFKILLAFCILSGCILLYFYYVFQRHSGPITDHFDGRKFHNINSIRPASWIDVLKWKWTNKSEQWPVIIEAPNTPPLKKHVIKGVHLTFINHATFLIQMGGMNILTDPVWSDQVGPLNKVGPHRNVLPGVPFNALPKIDVILISHDHYDHLDKDTLKKLIGRDNPIIYTGLGIDKIINDIQPDTTKIKTLDWWNTEILQNMKITFVPAQHWSGRWILDNNTTLWGGFVLEGGDHKIYFAGDTGYGYHFKEIHKKYGKMDVTLLPIGAYKPRWFMKNMHMSPEDAVKAHEDLQAHISIPMHYGTFKLSDEGYFEPLKDLYASLTEKNIPLKYFPVVGMGHTFVIP